MKNRVIIKPFGLFKLADSAIQSMETQVDHETTPKESVKKLAKKIKAGKSASFFGINPGTKELFSFVPIIEDNQFFVSLFPEPIQLYFSLAYSNYEFSIQTRNNIVFQKSQRKRTPFNFVNEYLYNWHLQYKISTIIFLHSTIEAFVNYMMPDEFIYKQEITGKKTDKFHKTTKEYNKEQTERYISFKEKISSVTHQITQINISKDHKKIYDNILNLSEVRNDLIHLRSTAQDKNQKYFEKVFEKLINIDLFPFVESVKNFVNLIKPDFIVIETINESNQDTFLFNFETFYAFKTDVTIFIKILSVETKNVLLKIPKSQDKNFQFHLNWIMQNLDQMAKEQLIYFPTINDDFDDRIEIKISKTDNFIFKIKKMANP